ncbi:MAG: hypothetical protein PSX81_06675 [bacterium]|nr:hypothetical protein [bacterium]
MSINPPNTYNVKRGDTFSIVLIYNSSVNVQLLHKSKNLSYKVVNLTPAPAAFVGNIPQPTTKRYTFQMNSDAIVFTIKIVNSNTVPDTSKFEFTVYAKGYFAIIPTGGLAISKFRKQYNYFYAPNNFGNATFFTPDGIDTFLLKKEQQGMNINIFAGTNFNYIINDKCNLGITAAFGYNLGENTKPINGLLGFNCAVGRRVKFNFGLGMAFMKVKVIPQVFLDQKIMTKFSSYPTLPQGFEKWMSGLYINFGVTLATLTN